MGVSLLGAAWICACGTLLPIDDGVSPRVDASTGDAAAPSDGASSDVSEGADGAETRHRVFVTSQTFRGDELGSVRATLCGALAADAGRAGRFVPWLSVSGAAMENTLVDWGPWYLFDDERVVKTKEDLLSDGPDEGIAIDELGQKHSGNTAVWTGTLQNGSLANNCSDWTDAGAPYTAVFGTVQNGRRWTNDSEAACAGTFHVYCFEQP